MGLNNKRKYLRNSSVRLLIPCAVVSYEVLTAFIEYYFIGDRHKCKVQGRKKNGMNLYLECSRTFTTELFCEDS